MSSKRAAAEGSKELFFDLLKLIATHVLSDTELASRIDSKQKLKAYYRLRYLTQRNYIQRNENRFSVTTKGKYLLSEREIWEITLPQTKMWDRKWHLVLFDIPKDKRKRRDIFRLRLKELGLVLYQNSVWVYPYPLEKEVRTIADFYKLSSCVSFAVAEKLTGEQNLRKQFSL